MNEKKIKAEVKAMQTRYAQLENSGEKDVVAEQEIVKELFNLIDRLTNEKQSLESEQQQLRGELNHLEGK